MAGPDLKLGIQPYVRLLKFHYPVDDLVLAVKGGNDESTSFASNGVQDRRKYNEVQAVAKQKPARVFLAVHRLDFSVYFCRISQESMCRWVPCGMEGPFSGPSSWLFTRARCRRPIARHPFNIRFKPGQLWAGSVSKMRTFGP